MKTILITGANRGIGLELTTEYLHDGWRVIATCREPKQAAALNNLQEKYKEQLNIIPLDVKNAEAIKKLPQILQHEKIDILINNAGVMSSKAEEFGSYTQSSWLDVLNVNTVAPYLITQALASLIAKADIKLIANMSSQLGSIELNEGGYDPYRASKAALNSITKTLAMQLKPERITVVSLHPGWVQTDMGGTNAPVKPEESVAGLRKIISRLSINDTGSFISFDGQKLPW